MILRRLGLCLAAWTAMGGGLALAASDGDSADDRLAAARRFVENSDRYLHHSKLRRGMEGYGLTVLSGTEIVKFQAKIVSVMERWGPHQDVILAMLSGHNLEHTGIIAGMSGSPVYMRDPADGKDKLIGAVAYGWRSQKDPLAGIQPITQMLAAGSYFKVMGGEKPTSKPAAATVPGGPGGPRQDVDKFLAAVMDPRKIDFTPLCMPRRAVAPRAANGAPELVPLATPLMVSGSSRAGLAELDRLLGPMGIVPVASGGAGNVEAQAARGAKLVPGAAIAVPLATGDGDWSAVGTVTDVVNGHVLAFGHSFFGEGATELPMGPAYVHTVVAGLLSSFKLSSGLDVTGTLNSDEQVAVGGVLGPKPATIPMTVRVEWRHENRKQTYRYNLCRHRTLTAALARTMIYEAAWGWHELPELHTVRYNVRVEFDKLGTFRSSNVATGSDISPALSDLSRAIASMMNNPFGQRIPPKRIDMDLTVEKGEISATMVDLKLDGEVYRPGETVTGKLTYQPFRQGRKTMPVQFKLPADLPAGAYTLTACDAESALTRLRMEQPQKFSPRTTEQLFEAIQRLVDPPAKQLYLRLPVPDGGGLALAHRELPGLPESKAKILAAADIPDTRTFSHSLVQTAATDWILNGSLSAGFRVERQPDETLLRD